jgi:hypothetical protein
MKINDDSTMNGLKKEVVTTIHRYIYNHYGNLIKASDPKYDKNTENWVSILHSDYPRLITDDRFSDKKTIRFISLGQIGSIRVGKQLQIVEASPRKECIRYISGFLDLWEKRAERIVVQASSHLLVKIDEFQWVLSKFGTIISNLQQNQVIHQDDVLALFHKQVSKSRLYMNLLEELGLIRQNGEEYTYGNLFVELQRNYPDENKLRLAILSHIIRERYSALRENFGISQMDIFVHLNSSYYAPALEAETLPYLKGETILGRYQRIYGQKDKLRMNFVLRKLVEVDALRQEENYYLGNEDIFPKMLDMKSKLSALAPSRA